MEPTRETFGNIPYSSQLLFYAAAAVTAGVFGYGVWRRFRLWRQGLRVDVGGLFLGNCRLMLEKIRPRLRRLLVEGLGQKRVRGRGLRSWAHGLLFAGFMVLLLGTTLLEIDHLAGMISEKLKFHHGIYYIVYEFALDVMGLLFLAGCVLFYWGRLRRPRSVGHRATDWYVLSSFLLIGLSGYLLEGLRITWQHPSGIGAECSPVGLWISEKFLHLSDAGARSAHFVVWWVHSALVFGFLASIPFTRLFHMIAGPLNIFLSNPGLGVLPPLTIEEVEKTGRVGIGEIRHLSQQQLLSLDACMECGRCEEACPAFATGKPLSPKKVIQDLRSLMTETLGSDRRGAGPRSLHGETIEAETLWSCTACSACVDICPVRIDQLTLILEMRRHLVNEGGLSGTAATTLRRMQSSGNPWGLPASDRGRWAENPATPLKDP